MEEVCEGVWAVGGPELSASPDAAVYLVDGGGEAALIDAGTGRGADRIRDNVLATGVPLETVRTLVLTHCHVDHTAGVPALLERIPMGVVAHRACAEILEPGGDPRTAADWYGMVNPPVLVDEPFEGALHRIPLGAHELVLHRWPGHSPGSIVATLDIGGQRVLFGQDVHGPIHRQLQSDWSAWQASLRMLLTLEADILCEGHYGVFRGKNAVAAFVHRFIE